MQNKNLKPIFFEFSGYKFKPREKILKFEYKIGFVGQKPLVFVEKIILPKVPDIKKIPQGLLSELLGDIHLMLGISYYKTYCPPKIKLAKALSQNKALFWETVYKKGLGEFFYRNNLDIKKKIGFPISQKQKKEKNYFLPRKNRSLVGVGGGKDSLAAIELLKQAKKDIAGFVVQTGEASKIIEDIVKTAGVKSLVIKRVLDEKLLSGLEQSYQGHIPISAIYGFLGLLLGILYDYKNIIVANEYSSNFGNLKYQNQEINHQWSKSAEFENLFQGYINRYYTPQIRYFSLLRPFYEIRIAEMFSRLKKYHTLFSSCNKKFANKKSDGAGERWCLNCPKCLSSFLLLATFLPKNDLLKIFKKNLFQEKALENQFSDILGFGKIKPFDCVGTFEENKMALYLAKNKFKNDFIIRKFSPALTAPAVVPRALLCHPEGTPEGSHIRDSSAIRPQNDRTRSLREIFSTHPCLNIPTEFRFLGMKNVLILGYGKEGKITEQYLKKYFPDLKIGVADQKQGSGYLKKQNYYDIAVKTPGVAKENLKIQYTTATNIFFSQVDNNKIIGITGSKGKSTTASLIFEILKTAGKNVQLLGNIGAPMLKALMSPLPKTQMFVLELSSYQLDDIEQSPGVAVITNLFPEHMNYHGNVENYFKAKKNIIKFQNKNNFFVYNPKVSRLREWGREARAKVLAFKTELPLKETEIPLLGEHNKDNIRIAATVGVILGVSKETIARAVKNFKPLPHRLELVGEFQGIKFYDDAISTAPESTIFAIACLPNVQTVFLGGEDRGYKFSELEKTLKKYQIKNIVLFPNSGKKILKNKQGFNILETTKMAEAVKFAFDNTEKNGVCLLSTASPSYNLWKNFEDQGEQFQKWVKFYGKKNKK